MDKKKVIELIQSVINENTDNISFGDDRHNEHLRTANAVLRCVLLELRKSDWISVEDELPEYDKEVFVTSKMSPDTIFKDRRVECTAFPKDSNDFIILWEGRMARITHWKPIKKLED